MKKVSASRKTRNLEQTRRQILEAAFTEIFARGFQGVSVDDIVKRTHLTKGAFYHHFPTKLDLGYALVEEVIRPMILERWITPLAAYKNPLDGILRQLKKHIGEQPVAALKYGCPLNNLVQEMAPIDAGFNVRLQAALNIWVAETQKHLERGQMHGHIRRDIDARQVAVFIVMSHEGFFGFIKGTGDKRAFDDLYTSLKQYFHGLRAI